MAATRASLLQMTTTNGVATTQETQLKFGNTSTNIKQSEEFYLLKNSKAAIDEITKWAIGRIAQPNTNIVKEGRARGPYLPLTIQNYEVLGLKYSEENKSYGILLRGKMSLFESPDNLTKTCEVRIWANNINLEKNKLIKEFVECLNLNREKNNSKLILPSFEFCLEMSKKGENWEPFIYYRYPKQSESGNMQGVFQQEFNDKELKMINSFIKNVKIKEPEYLNFENYDFRKSWRQERKEQFVNNYIKGSNLWKEYNWHLDKINFLEANSDENASKLDSLRISLNELKNLLDKNYRNGDNALDYCKKQNI